MIKLPGKVWNKVKVNYKVKAQLLGKRLLRFWLKGTPFCIVSNDCYGGELYRHIERPYNTPFVGLMIMGPCYIKLIGQLNFYMHQPLVFIESSKYEALNNQRTNGHHYPIGLLHDIEIHFLHYATAEEAKEKWTRRTERMDFNHICVKFNTGKDYITNEHVTEFGKLPFERKLCLASEAGEVNSWNVHIPGLAVDGAYAFLQSLPFVNLKGWISGKSAVNDHFLQKLISRIIAFLLIP